MATSSDCDFVIQEFGTSSTSRRHCFSLRGRHTCSSRRAGLKRFGNIQYNSSAWKAEYPVIRGQYSILGRSGFTIRGRGLSMDQIKKINDYNGYECTAWIGGRSKKQHFSFPAALIEYIAKHPSSAEVYSKIVRTCKYFVEKNPILVVKRYRDADLNASVCQKHATRIICFANKCCKEIDLTERNYKLWITESLEICHFGFNNFSKSDFALLRRSIYKCEIKNLQLVGTYMKMDDFLYFAKSVKCLHIERSGIYGRDGKIVMFEDILELLPELEEIRFGFDVDDKYQREPMFTAYSMKNFAKFKELHNLKRLAFLNIPEVFEVQDVINFIKTFKFSNVFLGFNEYLSLQFKNQIYEAIDDVKKEKGYDISTYDNDGEGLRILLDNHVLADFLPYWQQITK